jgi:hypothetical protein
MRGNDGLLASLERAVEIRGDNDIVGDETSRIDALRSSCERLTSTRRAPTS